MNLIIFGVGIIIGILVRDIKFKILETIEGYKGKLRDRESAQFFEPTDFADKFEKAESLDDLL